MTLLLWQTGVCFTKVPENYAVTTATLPHLDAFSPSSWVNPWRERNYSTRVTPRQGASMKGKCSAHLRGEQGPWEVTVTGSAPRALL